MTKHKTLKKLKGKIWMNCDFLQMVADIDGNIAHGCYMCAVRKKPCMRDDCFITKILKRLEVLENK